ncbi:MAG: CehA/McbA family metallohydrolase, partial [Verrucomicrobiota bacterium]|nr:CehA/McbA family metallohydrolase [Verrucomicrobiota bacterium]
MNCRIVFCNGFLELSFMQINAPRRDRALKLAPALLVGLFLAVRATGAASPEWQPFSAHIRRLVEALESVGEPLAALERRELQGLLDGGGPEAIEKIQRMLEGRCLFHVGINPEMRVKVARGSAKAELVEGGWRLFLVQVRNESGTTAVLRASSPQAQPLFGETNIKAGAKPPPERGLPLAERWLDLQVFNAQPLPSKLSGLPLEYRLVQLYSRDAGQRSADLSFDVGQGTQDLGFRNEVDVLFDCRPPREVTLRVRDEAGTPTTAAFLLRDHAGRVTPSQAKRLAPDFGFQPQIYRADGETVRLPDGAYTIEFSRGPESIPEQRRVLVDDSTRELAFQVRRWIDPAKMGWWSGDHHIHAAGCAHYSTPTEGVLASDMIRHIIGEDLKVGANLTWGPCFDYQKQFFTGREDAVSRPPYLLRYDVEVSGFGSHRSGHLCLLRLRDQMYPGGDSMAHWPTLGLNTLRWAKGQGALCGPAHSGWGLKVDGDALPNYGVPPYDGIGANEYIVDVTHEVPGPNGIPVPAVDFISLVDTPHTWELNMWYHTLNAGFRTRASGETDFPCIYGERVGLGRSYVKLAGALTYDDWCEGIRAGRCYVGDGRSHLLEFAANGLAAGENGSELKLPAPGTVRLSARVAARLDEVPTPDLRGLAPDK